MGNALTETATLDNPVWTALTGAQRHLGHVLGDMRRFAPDLAPFCAVPEDGMFVPATDLEYLSGDVFFLGALPTLPAGWTLQELSKVTQMSYAGGPVAAPAATGMAVLDALDPGMRDLTALAFPGYFRERTGSMGRYVGIRDGARLVALAGERMDFGTAREVSAVCTHPDYTGRGHARLLMQHVMHGMQQQGVTPMLHVGSGNARALALYEALGFVRVRELRHARLLSLA
jgi:ribosomal protein S18 acetylase RimI-like enzyme